MKKLIIPALALALPAVAMAQSAVDAYRLSQTELRGTARFLGMGGAFTALGGDLSAVALNPASVGVYRSSEIGATLDVNIRNYKTDAYSQNQTKAYCNNFGYVGVVKLGGALRTFAWGASYNRIASFDRKLHGYNGATSTSLSNYIAAFTNGTPASEMDFTENYNPYVDSNNDWLSILGYSTYMINPNNSAANQYQGLFRNGTVGDADLELRERGYIDEYNLTFGGNVSDVVSWGVNIGITDLNYTREAIYSESMENAAIANYKGQLTTGNAGFELYTPSNVNGNGWNMNVGVILKPINELRIGLSVKTPTWWNLSHAYYGEASGSYYDPSLPQSTDKNKPNPLTVSDYTEDAGFDSRLHSPWKINIGVAGVIGGRAIVSLDYERTAFPDMKVKHQTGYYGNSFEDAVGTNADIKNYFQAANSLRLGVEYRVTPQFSLRAGYAWQGASVKKEASDGAIEILTSGTDPSFVFNNSINQVSVGAGYRFGQWYIDAAYVCKLRDNTYHAYTDFDGYRAPQGSFDEKLHSIVLSTGVKF